MPDYEDRVDGLNLKVVGPVDHIKTPPTVYAIFPTFFNVRLLKSVLGRRRKITKKSFKIGKEVSFSLIYLKR